MIKPHDYDRFVTTATTPPNYGEIKRNAKTSVIQKIQPKWSGLIVALREENRFKSQMLVIGCLRRQAEQMNAFGFIQPLEDGPVTFFFENVEDAVLGKVRYG